MEMLLKGTAAYKILLGDRAQGRLSHAYMLYFPDAANLRGAVKTFAALMYGAEGETLRRIMDGSFPDVKIFPGEDKKLGVDDASAIVDDCVIRPAEGDKKIYAITSFDTASAAVQNKLLKSLEEPPEGVSFLLGVASVAPVLATVLSRVKTLEIPPFSEEQIFACLERQGKCDANRAAASACGGILGVAQSMVRGGQYAELRSAALKICSVKTGNIGETAAEFGDFRNKTQLLGQIQTLILSALKAEGDGRAIAARWTVPALIWASENIVKAAADVKFNAQFAAVLCDLLLRWTEENEKWKKLSE